MSDPLPDKIVWLSNAGARKSKQKKADTAHFSSTVTGHVNRFHRTLPVFRSTPLAKLDNLARHLGVMSIRVKDESHRCGLNAFKILGASYALSTHLAQKLNLPLENLSFADFKSPELKNRLKDFTCITATDGNHGKAVAWAAKQLGCRAVIFMPTGTTPARLKSIKSLDADASIIEGNYDDAVRMAAEQARLNRWLLINLLKQPELEPLKKDLDINSNSSILLFSTEGDTDPEMYRKIVWGEGDFGFQIADCGM